MFNVCVHMWKAGKHTRRDCAALAAACSGHIAGQTFTAFLLVSSLHIRHAPHGHNQWGDDL